jgi:hypothetical protein
VNGKVEMTSGEMKRLQDKMTCEYTSPAQALHKSDITVQQSRTDELRDTHRLESKSQAELVSTLRSQLAAAEAKTPDADVVAQLRADLTKAQTSAKEEEEKRTKAISLLKTVRQKLVKVEKDKEEVEKDRAEERAQRSRALEDVEKGKAEREREVNALRKNFERELAGVKERSDKELAASRSAWEMEMVTTKVSEGIQS